MAELQEGQGDDQGDEDVDEEPTEDIVGRTPQCPVVPFDDFLELHPERGRI